MQMHLDHGPNDLNLWKCDDFYINQYLCDTYTLHPSAGVVLAVAVVFHFTAQYVTGKVALKVGR